jgi:hypothetical protein
MREGLWAHLRFRAATHALNRTDDRRLAFCPGSAFQAKTPTAAEQGKIVALNGRVVMRAASGTVAPIW